MKTTVWSIIATIFLGILVLVVTKLWNPIAEHVGYPFNVRRRVENLLDAVERLHEIQEDLLRLDPMAPSSSQICRGWLRRVGNLRQTEAKIKNGQSGCSPLNYFGMCHFGKRADEELRTAIDLIGIGNQLLREARDRPRSVRDAQPQHPQIQLWGMDSYKNKVQDFILNNNSNHKSGLLGIWGMAGVGKTSLLELVRDSQGTGDSHTRSFDHVLFVRAGRGSTVGTIQKAIVATMGLHSMPDETSQEGVIYNRLKDKSFLLLIDDLWGYHDLKHVGIPMPLGNVLLFPSHGVGSVPELHQRKVVFATRSYDVCGQMGCGNNAFRMECLSKGDAWKVFVDKVGNEIIKVPQLQKLARKVVDECSGLPKALCTIGQAMSTKKDPKEWRNAIDLMKKSKLREINVNDDLFESLKHSYDNLGNNLKDCFLICALWPRDENIPKEKLIGWWTGLGLLDLDVSNAIDRGYSIINCLVRLSMLEKGDTSLYSSQESHVKMHEVTRKMALWIANDQGDKDRWLPHSFCRSALPEEKWSTVQKAWISEAESSTWRSSFCCPELTMLVSRHAFSFEVSPRFQKIRFLDLEGTKRDKFPIEICVLEELQYLNLSSTAIDSLPLKLQELSSLKCLYLRGIEALETIPKDLISQLAKLRVLDLFCCGSISNKDHYCSSLIEELASKSIDFTLGITVHIKADILKLIQLKRVVHTQALCMQHFEDESHPVCIDLELLSGMKKLRELSITKSPDIQQLVAQGKPSYDEYGLLPDLEFLELSNLRELQNVTWNNAGLSIRVITIYNCTKLRHVTWVQCLETLQELTIAYCPELEKVIDNAEPVQDMVVANWVKSFGQLKKLYLEELPKLSIISEQSQPFEELSYVFVARCENLKIIRVEQRSNHSKIKIDCNEGWWSSLGENQRMNQHFVPMFCF